MDVSVVLTLVQTLLHLLESPIRREIESVWGFKSELRKLQATMSTIHAVLLDADNQERLQTQPLSNVEHDRLERLKEAVYEADDLFDEVATLAQRKEIMAGDDNNKAISRFLSLFSQIPSAFTMSREIKKIREMLDDIAKDHRDFGASLGGRQLQVGGGGGRKGRGTHSSICDMDVIIGRDDDKKAVISMLLDSTCVAGSDVSYVSIVGMGGLGKTTLAQLVYNDQQIIAREFPTKFWVCISDEQEFNLKVIIGQILVSLTNRTHAGGMPIDMLQKMLRKEIKGKKFLLVLDDVWNEDHNGWLELKGLLDDGGKGSRILVTTRSRRVAEMVSTRGYHQRLLIHELGGLSNEESWQLFERMARPEDVQPSKEDHAHLVAMGKEIVRKCAHVPLAIRVVGSLLRGQGESRWRSLGNIDLANIAQIDGVAGILPVLKLSYCHLQPPLKSCFSYCAIFPKNYEFIKEDLIHLWMAQGFVRPVDRQSMEDLGEEYFMILLQRCLFQDIHRDESGEIFSCKMHDLVHDIAKQVSGTEVLVGSADAVTSQMSEKTRHISTWFGELDTLVHCSNQAKRMRTLLRPRGDLFGVSRSRLNTLLSQARCLRVLGVHGCEFKKVPTAIGNLLHLRYLDLSNNSALEALPMAISMLHNLQTLKLRNCWGLKELPVDLHKLVNLRVLDIHKCMGLRYMPSRMNNLASLQHLAMFVVVGASYASGLKRPAVGWGMLRDLRDLTNLNGRLTIVVRGRGGYDAGAARSEAGYLNNKRHLVHIVIDWGIDVAYERDDNDDQEEEALLQGLQPHKNIKILELHGYPGMRFPRWDNSLQNPKLVNVMLWGCRRLQHLPSFSEFPYLKTLVLDDLEELEYVESCCGISSSSGGPSGSVGGAAAATSTSTSVSSAFFPSLERLVLAHLPKLKGWWRPSSSSGVAVNATASSSGQQQQRQRQQQQQQQQQQQLLLGPSSAAFPRLSHLNIEWCPNLVSLPFCPIVGELYMHEHRPKTYKSELSNIGLSNTKNNAGYLNLLLLQSFQHLSSLYISTSNLENLSDVQGCSIPWRSLQGSLLSLKLEGLQKLMNLPMGMQHLTTLQSLSISQCFDMEGLPEWMGCLSSLENLHISCCPNVKSLPESMRNLASLKKLEIWYCSTELLEKCENPTCDDWPKIQHIPYIRIK